LEEASEILDAITQLGKRVEKDRKNDPVKEVADGNVETDPLTDPDVLAEAIRIGILDAPHLKGNPYAAGRLETRCIDGGIHAWSREDEHRISEKERLANILSSL
jgi:hypothetical protein